MGIEIATKKAVNTEALNHVKGKIHKITITANKTIKAIINISKNAPTKLFRAKYDPYTVYNPVMAAPDILCNKSLNFSNIFWSGTNTLKIRENIYDNILSYIWM